MTRRPLAPEPVEARGQAVARWPFGSAPRVFVLLAAGLLLLVPAWIDRRAVVGMLVWDLFVVALWIGDVRQLPPPAALQALRRWHQPLTLGRPAEVGLEVRNGGGVTIRAWATDVVDGSLRRELAEVALVVAAGDTAIGRYTLVPSGRGDRAAGPLHLRYRSLWGLAERWAVVPLVQTVRVYPDLPEARRQSLFLIRSRQVAIEKRHARSPGLGREFESLRDHREGDELRDVCWTATARRARIITRVYQPERSQAVWLVVDAGRLLRARIERRIKLDYMVDAALAIAGVALTAGDRVALLTYGRRVHHRLAPGRGAQHLRAILEALAVLSAEPAEADHAGAAGVVLAAQKQRALVIWLTDLAETAGLPDVIEGASRLAARHKVLFVVMGQSEMVSLAAAVPAARAETYRILAAQETLERRESLLRGLSQRGVTALELMPQHVTSGLVDRYLTLKERNVI
jgi:uncharacterized protein (DUF58 family)